MVRLSADEQPNWRAMVRPLTNANTDSNITASPFIENKSAMIGKCVPIKASTSNIITMVDKRLQGCSIRFANDVAQ